MAQRGHPAGRHLRHARRHRGGARRAKADLFLRFFDGTVAVMFRLTDYVMALTPLGVFGAMAGAVSHHGLDVLASYAKLVASLYGRSSSSPCSCLSRRSSSRREHPDVLP
jgi:hypothetical protein